MYKVTVENRGDGRYQATTRHASFVMSTDGKEANPVDTLLAALGGCVGHYVRDFLRDRAIPSPGFTIAAQAEGTPDQSRLAGISVQIDLGETRLEGAAEAELLAFIERCKVYGTLRRGCPIEVALVRRGAAEARPDNPGREPQAAKRA